MEHQGAKCKVCPRGAASARPRGLVISTVKLVVWRNTGDYENMKMHYPWGNLGCMNWVKNHEILRGIWSKCKKNYENALSLGKSWVHTVTG
jgi:hypothetical protein